MTNWHNSFLISVIGLALTGCGAQEIEENPDVVDSATEEVSDTASDTTAVVCCPINSQQNFCDTEIPFGGAMTLGGECWIGSHDGGGPADGWRLSTDEFGCPIWQQVEPTTVRCAEPDGGQSDVPDVDDVDTSDAGDELDAVDSADSDS